MDNSEVNVAIVAAALQLLTIVVGLYYFKKKFPIETTVSQAEANSENAAATKQLAEASSAWLENHNRMFELMQQRDQDIIGLNRRLLELEELHEAHQRELAAEKALRQEAQEKLHLAEVENKILRAEITELRQLVQTLQKEIFQLKMITNTVFSEAPIPE